MASAAEYLRAEFPAESGPLSPARLYEAIVKATHIAEAHGLDTPYLALAFCDMCWRAGGLLGQDSGFDWAADILTAPHLSGEDKLDLLRSAWASLEALRGMERDNGQD